MAFVQLSIDPKYHKHIIGRNGANGKYSRWLSNQLGFIWSTNLVIIPRIKLTNVAFIWVSLIPKQLC